MLCPKSNAYDYDPTRKFLYAIAYHALGREKESDAALRELIAKYQEDATRSPRFMLSGTSPTKRSSGWTELMLNVMTV